MSDSAFVTIIGLEVHVQLAVDSKLFCRCSTTFGAAPNTQTCPVCIGMPGSLPVMNRRAYELAIKTAVALNCDIPAFTKWDRKQYYYPDLPKGYQISQFDLPMSDDGFMDICDVKEQFEPKRVRIIRAHLEEDAGKSVHDEAAGEGDSEIDLNRTGTPLLEIVTQPDLRSSAEAKAFLQELKLLLTYLDVSDCNMQEGSLRVDANVNLHIDVGNERVATPIVEVKNMNSFRAVERALNYEADRQFRQWKDAGQRLGEAPKQTRGWDDDDGVTRPQRGKEESSDYRYFPDPDLVPVVTTAEEIDALRETLGELPASLRARLSDEYGLSAYDADVLVNQGRSIVDYYLRVVEQTGDAKLACNWVTQHVLRTLKSDNLSIQEFVVDSSRLAGLIAALSSGDLPSARAPHAFQQMVDRDLDVAAAMETLGIERVDESELTALCQELIAANPKIVADLQAGKKQAIGALIGQAKKRNPNVDPARLRAICLELVQSRDGQ